MPKAPSLTGAKYPRTRGKGPGDFATLNDGQNPARGDLLPHKQPPYTAKMMAKQALRGAVSGKPNRGTATEALNKLQVRKTKASIRKKARTQRDMVKA